MLSDHRNSEHDQNVQTNSNIPEPVSKVSSVKRISTLNPVEDVLDKSAPKKVISAVPRERQKLLKWNGWGYNDSQFKVTGEETANDDLALISFTGDRYPIGNHDLPYFKEWVMTTFGVNLMNNRPAEPMPTNFPEPVPCHEFLEDIKQCNIQYSTTGIDRLFRSHGHTLADIFNLRSATMNRIPDLVLWPMCHNDVVHIVQKADEHNVVLIPFGGGTSVSGSITCPQHEKRPIVILDTSQMNRLLWLDKENMVACFESGIIGQDLEKVLKEVGFTVGHEPDSFEFSSLGGWVATRASGMKKNIYGNIEDLAVKIKMVTTKGVLEKNCTAPRVSLGPDFNHVILGSEGTLGVITEVILKIRKLPLVKQYGSLVFPSFEDGIKCLREIAENRLQPASIRLLDNEQFQFGQALKIEQSLFRSFIDGFKKSYLTRIKGFDLRKISVATLVFEGRKEDVVKQQKDINEIAVKYGGIPAGAENGERGYLLTFVIAYIRDLALEYFIVAESFETSVPWARCATLCKNTKIRVRRECKALGIEYSLVSCRITQTYDAGAAVYFYFAFNYTGVEDPVKTYEFIEDCARDEIIACGGSLSHHHGIGKLRSKWYPQSVSDVGVQLYKATKQELDPKNIFAAGNLLPDNDNDKNLDSAELNVRSKL